MNPEQWPPGLPGGPQAGPQRSLAGRILAGLAGAVVLVLSLLFSVVVFSVLLVVGLVVIGYFWWRTREMRKRMREAMERQAAAQPSGGRVIEGEVIRD